MQCRTEVGLRIRERNDVIVENKLLHKKLKQQDKKIKDLAKKIHILVQEQAELSVLQRERFDAELHLKTVQIRILTRELSQLKEQACQDETFECIEIVSSDNCDDEN